MQRQKLTLMSATLVTIKWIQHKIGFRRWNCSTRKLSPSLSCKDTSKASHYILHAFIIIIHAHVSLFLYFAANFYNYKSIIRESALAAL